MNNNTKLKIPTRGGKNRDSGIELLKVIAINLIVISHVVQTLGTNYGFGTFSDYVIELGNSTTDITTLILTSLRYLGGIGNDIFFISTAWFMIDKKPRAKKKILTMVFDVWVISVIMLSFVLCFRKGNLNGNWYGFISSFFPVSCGNNWYVTCYILFCFAHPYINLIIERLQKRELLRVATFMTIVYIFINFLRDGLFFSSKIIVWISIYFLIAYFKKYTTIINNSKINILLVVIGIIGNIALIITTNCLGFKYEMFYDKVLYWYKSSSPFLILISFGLFNFFRSLKLKSKIINYISNVSLYIYLIHENVLFAMYCRSAIWHQIYIKFGHEYVLVWVFVYSAVLFIVATILSMIYQLSVHKLVVRVLDKVYPSIKKIYIQVEDRFLSLK